MEERAGFNRFLCHLLFDICHSAVGARKKDVKCRSGSAAGIEPDFSSMRFDTRLGDRKAESRAGWFLIGHKWFKHLAADLFWDSRPVIGNRDQKSFFPRSEDEGDLSAILQRFPRILDNVC